MIFCVLVFCNGRTQTDMRISLTTGLSLLLISVALTASVWAIFLSGSPIKTLPKQHQNAPDAYMEKVSATIFNAAGIASMHIESPRMVHYPKDDITLIQSPMVTLYRKTSGPWHVSADQGLTNHGIDKVFLKKNVVVHHPANPLDPEMKLTTQSLTVLPRQEAVETQDPVTITQPHATIQAVGMNANFNTGIVHLLSDTRSDYVPAS